MNFNTKLRHIKVISHSMSAAEWRFWGKIDMRSDDECWYWTSAYSGGRAAFGTPQGMVYAARYMWFLKTGAMPVPGMVVRHMCDNPSCVNPAHLCIGTHADNMRDKVLRGRTVNLPRIDKDIMQAAMAAYRTGQYTQAQIADGYGIGVRALQRALEKSK